MLKTVKSIISMPNTFYRTIYLSIVTLLLSACSKPVTLNIPFDLTYHNTSVSCQRFGDGSVSNARAIKLNDFRLYLHDIQLQNSDGDWVTLSLNQDGPWQNATTALLDFEDAQEDCESGNKATNTVLSGTVPDAQYRAIRFKVGVPFELNHQNPLIAKAPLNESSLHWHWQGGYKFVRAEFSINNQSRRLHIGSLQCKGEINAISHCEKPNRPEVLLTDFDDNTTINIALDKLIDFSHKDQQSNLTCMGGSEKTWCANALNWIGLGEQKQPLAFNTIKGTL